MKKKSKQPKTTVQKLNFWKRWRLGLTVGEFGMPLIPFGIILGINWSDWVGNSASEGWSIGMGFGMLIVSVICAIIGIWKKDEMVKSKVSGIFYVAIVLALMGFSFKLLASIFNSFGDMLLYVCFSVVGSGVVAQVNKSKVQNEVRRYERLVRENGLDKKSARELEDEEQARQEGKEANKERKVDLL